MNLLLLTLVLGSFVIAGTIQYSYADKYNIIEVIPSQICSTLMKQGIDSSCPTVGQLMKYDTSNQHFSGKFVTDKNGHWSRTPPQLRNHYMWYTNETVCVMCDIPMGQFNSFKTIIIEDKNFTWLGPATQVINGSFPSLHSVYATSCNTITIAFSPAILNDTINFLKSGCTAKQQYNNTSSNPVKTSTPLDYTSPYIYRWHNWLASIGKIHYSNCIIHHCFVKSLDAKW